MAARASLTLSLFKLHTPLIYLTMFDLPNAKRCASSHISNQSTNYNSIRRDDVHHQPSSGSPSRSPSPPAEEYQDGHERLGRLLNFDTAFLNESTPQESRAEDQNREDGGEEEQEEEFEFRLFGPSTQKPQSTEHGHHTETVDENQPTQKLRIRLRSPTPGPIDSSQGRFVRPSRGWEYHFTTPRLLFSSTTTAEESAYAEKKRQFEDVAITGAQLMGWSERAWPGCHYPWRVMHLKRENAKLPPGEKAVYLVDPPVKMEAKSRRKPGKKRRIQLRKREIAAEQAKETDAEKRNRKNRERKIKRRQKAREMKAAGQAVEEESIAGSATS